MVDAVETSVEAGPAPIHERPADRPLVRVHESEIPADRRRGAEIRTLLSPRNAKSVSGFLGVARLQPGESIAEHYHPYSEEFLHVVRGDLEMRLNGEPVRLGPGDSLLVPIGVRHRLVNVGTEEAHAVFHLSPLAPRPDLGHVDTEPLPAPEQPNPDVGGRR